MSEVVASNNDKYQKGDIVLSRAGWQTHVLSDGSGLRKLDPKLAPVSTALGVLGMPGMTAYTGLLEIGQPKAGETVVVSAASGAVGSVVGQIARIKGARAVGIAGGPEKCRYVKDELGFDDCVDHRDPALAEKLKAACPKGIDVYFENVGGAGVGRGVSAAQYVRAHSGVRTDRAVQRDRAAAGTEPRAAAFPRRADQAPHHPRLHRHRLRGAASTTSSATCRNGSRKAASNIARTSPRASRTRPQAFMGLLKGKNFGKQLVRVAE